MLQVRKAHLISKNLFAKSRMTATYHMHLSNSKTKANKDKQDQCCKFKKDISLMSQILVVIPCVTTSHHTYFSKSKKGNIKIRTHI